MDNLASLSRMYWDCKHQVVFIPTYHRNVFYGQIRKDFGQVFASWASQKESHRESGSLQPDHVRMLISIAFKYLVPQVVRYVKGKSAIYIAHQDAENQCMHQLLLSM